MAGTSDQEGLTVQIHGSTSRGQLRDWLDGLDDSVSIASITLELEVDEPSFGGLLQAPKAAEPEQEAEESPTRRLQLDGDPFYVAWALVEGEGWLLADGIESHLRNEWDVNTDVLSSTLYNLDDRGLVEKRPYEEDGRYKEYRITETGQEALSAAIGRSEQHSESDLSLH